MPADKSVPTSDVTLFNGIAREEHNPEDEILLFRLSVYYTSACIFIIVYTRGDTHSMQLYNRGLSRCHLAQTEQLLQKDQITVSLTDVSRGDLH